MKRVVLVFVATLVIATGCAPDQLPSTATCTSITDCTVGKACDASTHTCIPEPEDRFLGAFNCKVTNAVGGDLQLSEVVGRASGLRWALPNVTCGINDQTSSVAIQFNDLDGGETLITHLPLGASGRIAFGPAIIGLPGAKPHAEVSNDRLFVRDGSSRDGFIQLSTALVEGALVQGYIDVTLTPPPRHLDAAFGVPCAEGIAQCGRALPDVGGALACYATEVLPTAPPYCTRRCAASSDCALGKGVCNHGFCTRRCATDADCTDLGRSCTAPANADETMGCF